MDEQDQTQVGVVTLTEVKNGYEASYKGSAATDATPESAVYELLVALNKLRWEGPASEKGTQKLR